MRDRDLRPMADVAITDEADAQRVLETFRTSDRVGVLCTVDMAGEGYDCPDIAVVGYATNKLTTLYVRQVVARAMRVTAIERELGRVIPAALVIPDIPVLVQRLVEYLAPFTHEILLPDEPPPDAGETRELAESDTLPIARYLLDQVIPGSDSVTVSHDGAAETFDGDVVRRLAEALEALNVPPVYAPRMLLASRRTIGDLLKARPFDPLPQDASSLETVATPARRSGSIEDRARLLQRELHRLEGWWRHNGNTPISTFAAEANRAAGIAIRGGRPKASPKQLQQAVDFEHRVIARYCRETGTARPRPNLRSTPTQPDA
jgi:hypothetical protein